ncbi:hypothetical protein OG884_12760 [Streptosporangium sp. NBC_01755]|uniref:hypothetical protein n=1 Tax=unclassified Streptosporangium TaxID=2632669 RepID=UPI002DD7F254|nr:MULTISPECIES: hypothetical protein [unclassified Streptosporangium]WSA29801.1 hypothetical protein OIE13_34100 [Streptosporangium sp. NBC_01810]WSD04313.1 hypothetical protein OG884_12760 [Streptosporangium sp. NBC_01755]
MTGFAVVAPVSGSVAMTLSPTLICSMGFSVGAARGIGEGGVVALGRPVEDVRGGRKLGQPAGGALVAASVLDTPRPKEGGHLASTSYGGRLDEHAMPPR